MTSVDSGQEAVEIARERIAKACTLIFALASGECEMDRMRLDSGQRDAFSELEALLNAFGREFLEAKSEGKRLQEEQRAVLETLKEQRDSIAALTAPLIDIWTGVVALPIVGELDAERTAQTTQRLLQRIKDGQIHHVIVDVTGARTLDGPIAHHLCDMLKAARLLGAGCVITGVQPALAQSLVASGVDLDVATERTLHEGLLRCLRDRSDGER